MKSFRATVTIQAPADKIWRILTDAAHYPDWDPNMLSIQGRIAEGEKLAIKTKLAPNQTFHVTVRGVIPAQKMIWASGLPMGLFKGERTFSLEAAGNGATQVTTQEIFEGLLLPLFGRTIPDLTPTFEAFLGGLKQQAEKS